MPSRFGLALATGLAVLLVAACSVADDHARNRAAGTFRSAQPGVLRVATSEIPVAGFWEGTAGRPDGGLEWGLAEAMRERFGLRRTEVVVVDFRDLVAGRFEGADLALAQITPTSGRHRHLDFSEPYLPSTPAVLVRAGTRVDDIAGARQKRWSVVRGTTLETFLVDTIAPDHPALLAGTQQQSIDDLRRGTVSAVLIDLPSATAIASTSGGRLKVAGQFARDESLAVALPRGSPNTQAVDSAVRAFKHDGTLERLAERWLGLNVDGGRGVHDIPVIYVST